jgi:hypothetical protein
MVGVSTSEEILGDRNQNLFFIVRLLERKKFEITSATTVAGFSLKKKTFYPRIQY